MKSKLRTFFLAAIVAFIIGFFIDALVAHAAPTVVPIFTGGTGTSTVPAYGQLLVGGKNGEFEYVSSTTISGGVPSVFGRIGAITAQAGDYTTSLVNEGSNLYFTNARAISALTGANVSIFTNDAGYLTGATLGAPFYTLFHATTTDALTEGASNLYFTNGRADARFITDLAATSSVKSITTLPSLSLPYSQLTSVPDLTQYLTLSAWYGTTTDQLKEGSTNLYFTNARADARFVADLAATSSVASITTLGNLALPATQLTGTLGVAHGGTGSTTLSGILKGNGTSQVQTAVGDTDYQKPITLTTTGTSGAATFVGDTLNVPQYAGTTYTAAFPITLTGSVFGFGGLSTSTNAVVGNLPYFSGASTFANVSTSSETCTSPLSCTAFNHIGTGGAISISQANGSTNGYLASSDWTVFNNKVSSTSLSAAFPLAYNSGSGAFSFNGLSTSSAAVTGNVPYFSGPNTFANIATGTVTCTGSVTCGAGASVLGSGITINGSAASSTLLSDINTWLGQETFNGTTTAATTTLVAIDNGGQVFNVKAFGAKGDGVTNDQTSIQLAIGEACITGGTVFFPSGTYMDGATPITPCSNVSLLGEAYGAVTLKKLGGATGGNADIIRWVVATSSTYLNNFTMRNIILDGTNQTTGVGDLATIQGANNTTLDHIGLVNPGAFGLDIGSNGGAAPYGDHWTISDIYYTSTTSSNTNDGIGGGGLSNAFFTNIYIPRTRGRARVSISPTSCTTNIQM